MKRMSKVPGYRGVSALLFPGGTEQGRVFINAAVLIVALLFSGCATMHAVEDSVDARLTSQSTIYRDQWVNKNPPEVHIQPKEQASTVPRVLFVPLRVTQPMQAPGMASHAVSRAIFQTWNTMQLFPAFEYSSDETPYRRDRALQLARMRGADMVVGGFITYLYAGGTAGDTQLAVQLEGIDTVSGQIVWSMAQGGAMPASKTTDYIFFAGKTRLPADPMHAIAKALAGDMGKIVQNWISGATPRSGMQKLDEKVRDTVFPNRDAVPPPRPRAEEGYGDSAF